VSDRLVFLKRFLSNPRRVGSVAPSSRFLCKRMMESVSWEQAGVIVELGPGTGVFTREILRRKRPEAAFFAIERDPYFQQILRERFPDLVIREEAVQLCSYLQEINLPGADVVISGLPFAIFSEDLRARILDQVVESLNPGGRFVTFQYSLQLKGELEKRFADVKVGFTPWNLPPAFVYTCQNKRT
jgi:phospholipid N-methyltransferase